MKKLKMGMVGGGEGAFIGAVHRLASSLDGQIELVCGAFSSDPEKSVRSGMSLGISTERCYGSFQDMFEVESSLPAEQRMDFVSIVTPNHLHFPVTKAAFEAGFHVLCDKPATFDVKQALQLQGLQKQWGKLFGLTHTYNGYPMVKEARAIIESGELGNVIKVVVEYTQGWLADQRVAGNKQAAWRLSSDTAGISCCMADIGVHAANLAEYITGQTISAVCADLNRTVSGRMLDDDGSVLLRFNNGASGVLIASQIAIGDENNLRIRVYGDKRSLEWSQLEPNTLWLRSNNEPTKQLRTGVGELSFAAQQSTRTPAGHPEGYIEAFANIYQNFANLVRAHNANPMVDPANFDVPGVEEAIRGMAFIQNVVTASESATKWHTFTTSLEGNTNE